MAYGGSAHRFLLIAAAAVAAGSGSRAFAVVAFQDDMNRSTFNAAANGWVVQTYARDKGSFGLVPTAVNANTAFRYFVKSDAAGTITQTNTVTSATFGPPVAGQYLEFSTSVNLSAAAASTPGLVFGISAYGQDAASHEYATNFEFVTKQLNTGNPTTAYDRLSLTSFNNYSSTTGGVWSAYVESGANATAGFHTYAMRLFTGKVIISLTTRSSQRPRATCRPVTIWRSS